MATYEGATVGLLDYRGLEGGSSRIPRNSRFTIRLSRKERETLETRARKYRLPYYEVQRAKMIFLAADGLPNEEIATALSIGRDGVSLWHKPTTGAGRTPTPGPPPDLRMPSDFNS